MAVTSATQYTRPGSGRATATKTGRFAAAIFTIRQARRRAGQAARERPPTDLVMRTPPGRSRACASAANLPDKGIVRALSGSVTGPAKGIFRAVGAASTTTVRRGTWITQDKCNGTLTEVGRGQAVVRDIGRERTVTVGRVPRTCATAVRRPAAPRCRRLTVRTVRLAALGAALALLGGCGGEAAPTARATTSASSAAGPRRPGRRRRS